MHEASAQGRMGFSVPPYRLPLTRLSILLIEEASKKSGTSTGTKRRQVHERLSESDSHRHIPKKTLPVPLAIASVGCLHLQFAQISFPYPATCSSVRTKTYVQTQPGWQGKPDCPAIGATVKPYGAVKPCRRRNKRSAERTPPYRKQPSARLRQ